MLLYYLSIALQVVMVIHWIRRQPEWFWLFLIIFLGPLGSLIYFIVVVLPDLQGGQVFQKRFEQGKHIRQLKARLGTVDLPYVHYELGSALFDRKKYTEASKHLEKALAGPEDIMEARYLLGMCHARQSRHEEAIKLLSPIVKKDPQYRYGEAYMQLGRSLLATGKRDEAYQAFSAIVKQTASAESRYHYASLLSERGEKEQAKETLTRLIAGSRDLPRFKYRQELRWLRATKKLLRNL